MYLTLLYDFKNNKYIEQDIMRNKSKASVQLVKQQLLQQFQISWQLNLKPLL